MPTQAFVDMVSNATDGVLPEAGDLLAAVRSGATVNLDASRVLIAKALTNAHLTPNSGSAPRIQWDNVVHDPLGLITPGASWKLTIPAPGWYDFRVVDSFMYANGNTWSVLNGIEIDIYKGTSTFLETLWYWETPVTTAIGTFNIVPFGTVAIEFAAGDEVFLKLDNFSGASRRLSSGAGLEVYKVG